MKTNQKPQKTTTKISWKIMKTNQSHDIENHRWLSPNNHISCDGNVCPKNIGIASHRLEIRPLFKSIWQP